MIVDWIEPVDSSPERFSVYNSEYYTDYIFLIDNVVPWNLKKSST